MDGFKNGARIAAGRGADLPEQCRTEAQQSQIESRHAPIQKINIVVAIRDDPHKALWAVAMQQSLADRVT